MIKPILVFLMIGSALIFKPIHLLADVLSNNISYSLHFGDMGPAVDDERVLLKKNKHCVELALMDDPNTSASDTIRKCEKLRQSSTTISSLCNSQLDYPLNVLHHSISRHFSIPIEDNTQLRSAAFKDLENDLRERTLTSCRDNKKSKFNLCLNPKVNYSLTYTTGFNQQVVGDENYKSVTFHGLFCENCKSQKSAFSKLLDLHTFITLNVTINASSHELVEVETPRDLFEKCRSFAH